MNTEMHSALNSYVKALFFILLAGACSNKDAFVKPTGIISQDSMVSILTDIHLVEGAKIGRKIIGDTLTANDYYNKIYNKHSISKEKFDKSFEFYNNHVKIMDKVHEIVIEKLNSLEIPPPRPFKHEEIEYYYTRSKVILDSLGNRGLKTKPF